MSDPVWDKVHELCKGYPPEFNAQAAYDVVEAAWRLGFDVVRAPDGSNLYQHALQNRYEALKPAKVDMSGFMNAAKPRS